MVPILQMGKYVTERLSDLSSTMQHISIKKRLKHMIPEPDTAL